MPQKVQRCRFIRPDHELAGCVISQLSQRIFQLALQVFKPAGKFEDNLARIRKNQVAARSVDQLLSQG
jgi:hypothetical protein